jgi:hypothetical protein
MLLLLACSGSPSSLPEPGDRDSGDSAPPSSVAGDALLVRANLRPEGFWEFLDAGFDARGRAVFGGVGGLLVVDPETGAELFRDELVPMSTRMALEGDTVWLSQGTMDLFELSLGEDEVSWTDEVRLSAPALDLDAQDGRVYVASAQLGLQVFQDGHVIGSLGGERGRAIAVDGERALFVDDSDLVLVDISEPSAPRELSRQSLGLPGRDVALDGLRGAVGLGSSGVQLVDLDDDTLTLGGRLSLPGSALRLDLDGEHLWIAGWEVSALALWPEGGDAVVVGHELPGQSAMGIAAREGLAAVAGWGEVQLLEATGADSGELHLPRTLQLSPGATRALEVTNWGSRTLSLELQPTPELTLSTGELELEPGASGLVTLELDEDAVDEVALPWTSDDPDEPSGSLLVQPAHELLGTEHRDFTLEGFLGPTGDSFTTTLSDHRGEVVLLAYWSSW